MKPEKILKESTFEDYDGTIAKRKLVIKDVEYVLTAQKYVIPKDPKQWGQQPRYWDSVGYLIDNQGNLTRDVSSAFVFTHEAIVCVDEREDKRISQHEWDFIRDKCHIEFSKNGLFITCRKLSEAQSFLDDHPFPRKNISPLVRGNVWAKYNGRCAYCGCDIELEEMQVDHFKAHMGGGGDDSLDNYYPACEVCNRVKSNSSIDGFKERIRHCGEIHRNRKKPIMADSDKIAIKYDLTKEDHEIKFFYETYNPKIDVKKIKEVLKSYE